MKGCKSLFVSLLACLLTICWTNVANGDEVVFHRQTIKNDLPNQIVNDAEITVDKAVDAGRITNANDTSKTGRAVVNGTTLIFAQGLFGNLETNLRAFVDIGPQDAKITGGQWTFDGVKKGAITTVGQPMQILFNSETKQAASVFFNPEEFAITYSNIMLFANNDLANLNLDQFLTPTGTLIATPSSITLAPGESIVFSFGVVSDSLYQLALAQVAPTSDPTDLFDVATAAQNVPEPTTVLLLATGLAGVAMNKRRRQRRRKDSSTSN